jgi:hypothetical protein
MAARLKNGVGENGFGGTVVNQQGDWRQEQGRKVYTTPESGMGEEGAEDLQRIQPIVLSLAQVHNGASEKLTAHCGHYSSPREQTGTPWRANSDGNYRGGA